MEDSTQYLLVIGRILVGFLFFFAGVCNIYYRKVKEKVIANRGLPFPGIVLAIGITAQIIAGLAVIFNFYIFPALIVLFLFNVLSLIIFHNFWNATGEEYRLKLQGFNNNIGIFGALLLLGFTYLH